MTTELSNFAARMCGLISNRQPAAGSRRFDSLALELFALQFENNPAYKKICASASLTPDIVEHWTQIPAVPAAAFKELELSCIPPEERAAVFHSSGTTEQRPGRHIHNADSLALYEASLWPWFAQNVLPDFRFPVSDFRLLCLTPPPVQAPHSSLVHMFETVRQKLGADESVFAGRLAADGSWTLDFDRTLAALGDDSKPKTQNPKLILGTAFSFVHLLDLLAEQNLVVKLSPGSRVMETGGYKNRSRSLPKNELHALVTEFLGISSDNIISEYGMSELSSQAYDTPRLAPCASRLFTFPPWAQIRIISPETGREVRDGEMGLIRVFDLANVFSVAAIQTEDMGIRCGDGFELIGRAQRAEPRGCSLMNA